MAALQSFAGAGAERARRPRDDAGRPGRHPVCISQAGAYQLWVQVKRGGNVLTGAFDVNVR